MLCDASPGPGDPRIGEVAPPNPDAVVRRAAARSLGMLPEAAATSALTAAAGDPDASVRKQVIWALRRRGVLDP